MKKNVLENNSEIIEIYDKLDLELSKINPGCNACGICCHFNTYGHVLYTSNIEVNYILENVNVPPHDPNQNICPFLKDNVCTIRDFRMLGCRVFFCNPHYRVITQEVYIYSKYYNMMKEVARKNQIEWHYAPMMKLL
jgi:Fe-S-cluster containining protein